MLLSEVAGIIFHRIASHRIASHRIASHRIASHRIASHRIASHRIASHRIASVLLIFQIVNFFSCSNSLRNEYELLKKSGIPTDELVNLIEDYDKAHYRFLDSKLDLGIIELMQLNYDRAFVYLNRAEALVNSGESCTNTQKAVLFSSLSTIYLSRKNINKAEFYAQKAYKSGRKGKHYGYLYGSILYSLGKSNESLKIFDKTYKKFPEEIDINSIRIYMYLLADLNYLERCRDLIEINSAKGNYFENYGTFASQIYERLGDLEQSIYYAYLEFLFQKQNRTITEDEFLNNLNKLETAIKTHISSHDKFEEQNEVDKKINHNSESVKKALSAINQIKINMTKEKILKPYSNNYISKYIFYKQKIFMKEFNFNDYKALSELEPYFCNLCEFYEMLLLVSPNFLTTNNPTLINMLKNKIKKLGGKV